MTHLYEEDYNNGYEDLPLNIQEILEKWDEFLDNEEDEHDWND